MTQSAHDLCALSSTLKTSSDILKGNENYVIYHSVQYSKPLMILKSFSIDYRVIAMTDRSVLTMTGDRQVGVWRKGYIVSKNKIKFM